MDKDFPWNPWEGLEEKVTLFGADTEALYRDAYKVGVIGTKPGAGATFVTALLVRASASHGGVGKEIQIIDLGEQRGYTMKDIDVLVVVMSDIDQKGPCFPFLEQLNIPLLWVVNCWRQSGLGEAPRRKKFIHDDKGEPPLFLPYIEHNVVDLLMERIVSGMKDDKK